MVLEILGWVLAPAIGQNGAIRSVFQNFPVCRGLNRGFWRSLSYRKKLEERITSLGKMNLFIFKFYQKKLEAKKNNLKNEFHLSKVNFLLSKKINAH